MTEGQLTKTEMITHCPFCKRDTVEQNLCIICYFNFDNIDKKSDFI